jgi:hypothetical protein
VVLGLLQRVVNAGGIDACGATQCRARFLAFE